MDLSYNNLRVLEAAHTRLGNIKTLNLAGNQLEQLTGLTKLYSLVNLDLSHNQVAQVGSSDEGSLRTNTDFLLWQMGRREKRETYIQTHKIKKTTIRAYSIISLFNF